MLQGERTKRFFIGGYGMDTMDRRHFIKSSAVGASLSLLAASPLKAFVPEGDDASDPRGKMITRRLGSTGIVLPVVSMGVMRADNPALVHAALKAGMKHLDTAHSYQKGNNELMLGEVLKDYPRNSFVISTKISPDSKEDFLENLDLSLRRLKMDYVDLLYVHGLSSADDVLAPATLEALKAARQSGKTRHVGVSTHRNEPEVIRAAIKSGVYEVVLSSVNFKQDHYAEVKKAIAEAAAAGIGIIAMKTMAGAFHDRERKNPINCKAALKWALQDANITTAIPGMTTFDQLTENSSVNFDLAMTETEKSALIPGKTEGGLYCPGCTGCTERCAKGLPVPDLMRAYMYTYGYRDPRMAQDLLADLGVRGNPCGDCGECSVGCSRGFDVSGRVRDITRLTTVPEEFLS
jgi:predicted aldo/keto reductase-like oxidoreductase